MTAAFLKRQDGPEICVPSSTEAAFKGCELDLEQRACAFGLIWSPLTGPDYDMNYYMKLLVGGGEVLAWHSPSPPSRREGNASLLREFASECRHVDAREPAQRIRLGAWRLWLCARALATWL